MRKSTKLCILSLCFVGLFSTAIAEDAVRPANPAQALVDQANYNPHLHDTVTINNNTIAHTKYGDLQGSVHDGIYQFLGVPYGDAQKRFQKAEPVKPWKGVRQATQYGLISEQKSFFGEALDKNTMSNNALNLNIWTPSLDTKSKKPVMVWLHGGGFVSGSANEAQYDGENLSHTGDVVVVGVNHRLNALGFLDLSKYGAQYKDSGNTGMWDIVDALRWVKANISRFGGDPNNVTIFGESGGGAKVSALMGSPAAKGLFHKAIIESGATKPVDGKFVPKEISQEITDETLKELNIDANSIEKLQTMPIEEIWDASAKAQNTVANRHQIWNGMGTRYGTAWRPVIDGRFLSSDLVDGDDFAKVSQNVPLLIGSNLTEWNTITPALVHKNITPEIEALYKEAYPNDTNPNPAMVDTLIRLPMLKIMAHKADQQKAPVYAYVFTKKDANGAVYHTAEIPYVFDNVEQPSELANTMATAWANFARYGSPSAPGLPTWEPYNRETQATMLLDDTSTLRHNHDKELMKALEPDYVY